MNEFVACEWDRAQKALASAADTAPKDPDTTASRAYYTAFHAATALLALRGKRYAKHSAIRAAIHRDFAGTGEWPAELGEDYDGLMESRDVADSVGVRRVTEEAARLAMARA